MVTVPKLLGSPLASQPPSQPLSLSASPLGSPASSSFPWVDDQGVEPELEPADDLDGGTEEQGEQVGAPASLPGLAALLALLASS